MNDALDRDHDEAAERAGAERLARLTLALLMLAFPIVYAIKVAGGERVAEPARGEPSWVHLILITVGSWPEPDAIPSRPALDRLRQRGVEVGPIYTASDDPAAAAVSLWTGRYAPNHGVLSGSQALPFGAWTLAAEAREAGHRTAAYLEQPFVTRQNVAGFDAVIEAEDLGHERLADLADGFLRAHPDERRLVWLHLNDPGEGLADLDALLGAIQGTLAETGDAVDALTVVTGLGGPPRGWMEERCRVPLLMELPTTLHARNRSTAHLSQVDLTGLLRYMLRLDRPDAGAGENNLQSREMTLASAVQGSSPFEWVWIEGRFGHVLRRPGLRAQVDPAAPDEIPTYDLRVLAKPEATGRRSPALAPRDERGALEVYQAARREVFDGAKAAIDAF